MKKKPLMLGILAVAMLVAPGCTKNGTPDESSATGDTNSMSVTQQLQNAKEVATNAWQETKEATTNGWADLKESLQSIIGYSYDQKDAFVASASADVDALDQKMKELSDKRFRQNQRTGKARTAECPTCRFGYKTGRGEELDGGRLEWCEGRFQKFLRSGKKFTQRSIAWPDGKLILDQISGWIRGGGRELNKISTPAFIPDVPGHQVNHGLLATRYWYLPAPRQFTVESCEAPRLIGWIFRWLS
jgi:hypothetical protein